MHRCSNFDSLTTKLIQFNAQKQNALSKRKKQTWINKLLMSIKLDEDKSISPPIAHCCESLYTFHQQWRQKRATEERKKWMNVIWGGLMEENAKIRAEGMADQRQHGNENAETDLYGRGSKEIDAGSQIAGISGSPRIPDTYRATESTIHGNAKPTFAKRRTNSRDFPPSNRARWKVARHFSAPDLWMALSRKRLRLSVFAIKFKAVKNDIVK